MEFADAKKILPLNISDRDAFQKTFLMFCFCVKHQFESELTVFRVVILTVNTSDD